LYVSSTKMSVIIRTCSSILMMVKPLDSKEAAKTTLPSFQESIFFGLYYVIIMRASQPIVLVTPFGIYVS
jgi:hypothetical protein